MEDNSIDYVISPDGMLVDMSYGAPAETELASNVECALHGQEEL